MINLCSGAVSFAIRNAAVYSSIKGALDTLTRQQAVELGPHGIRVTRWRRARFRPRAPTR